MNKRRYAFVGIGGRGIESFMRPIRDEFPDEIEIVGIYDVNPGRMAVANQMLETKIPAFDSYAAMVEATQPDALVICTKDCAHAEYVVSALEANIEVFSEKPLCTTLDQVREIRAAAAKASATAHVTHNGRFVPNCEKLKEVILSGAIGEVLHVSLTELLDRFHGADYFRRWHREMANSGGLLIHKSSHHFDLINWLTDALPQTATAHGRLAFYGRNGAFRGKRCLGCPHFEHCDFAADLTKYDALKRLYLDTEHHDGYHRDGCVFDEAIDICDTVNGSISYDNGIEAAYSLIAYGSYEAMRISVEGTLGRIELDHVHGTGWALGRKDGAGSLMNDGEDDISHQRLTIHYPYKKSEDITATAVKGGHGGADPKLRKMLFSTKPLPDPLSQKASLEEAIQAVLVGLALNRSIAENSRPINVQTVTPLC